MALLWSIGKDSTILLWLCRKAFFGKIPFPVMHIDTTFKFPEMYEFRDKWSKNWKLNLLVEKNEDALKRGVSYATHDAFACCNELKTKALQKAIIKHGFQALLVGIRRDEHGIRAKENYFSSRNQDFTWDYQKPTAEFWDQFKRKTSEGEHVRIHPLLHWTEIDVWNYILREKIPVNILYFAKNGKRYRSLGCQPITSPVKSDADTVEKIVEEIKNSEERERSGRKQDKEDNYTMQKLRSLGYM